MDVQIKQATEPDKHAIGLRAVSSMIGVVVKVRYAPLRAAEPVTKPQCPDLSALDDKIIGYVNTIMERAGHDTRSTF
jgi:hypothetical protein